MCIKMKEEVFENVVGLYNILNNRLNSVVYIKE